MESPEVHPRHPGDRDDAVHGLGVRMRRVYQRQMKPAHTGGVTIYHSWEDIWLKDLPDSGPCGSLRKLMRQSPLNDPVYTLRCRYRVIER